MRTYVLAGVAFMLAVGVLPASAAFTTYDDFNDDVFDAAKWDGSSLDPGDYQETGGELQFNVSSAATINSTGTFSLPKAVGEQLTVEIGVRRWVSRWFTQPGWRIFAYNVEAGTGDLIDYTWMGAMYAPSNAGGYYKTKHADGGAWSTSDFRSPNDVGVGNGDTEYDYFRFVYKVVDDGGERHDFELWAKGAPQETDWRLIRERQGYTTRRDVAKVVFGAGNHELAVDYVQTEFIPEPLTLSLLGLGACALLRNRK